MSGSWRQMKPDWSVRLGEGDGTRIAGDDVLTVRRVDVPLPSQPVEEHLILVNGDRLPYKDKTLRLSGEKFHLHHANLEEGRDVSVPLAAVAVLWQSAPDRTFDAEKFRRRLVAGTRTRDIVCLRNGDIVAGVLSSLDQQKVEVEVEKKPVVVKMAQVAYIAFNTELAAMLRPKGVYARLILTDTRPGEGGRLSLTSASCDGTTLTGTTVFGARLSVPLHAVAAVDLQQGRAIYLSDLKQSKYEYHPYLDATWPFAADGNVAEHDLLLGGSTYDKGIGLHSHSRLTYRLAGAYRRFEALVGLDDKDGRRGSVRIRVLADGEPLDLGADRELTARSGPLPISVKVEGVRELTLEVQFGDYGDVQDVVDWTDARLVK
ncbi:MAG TPA: NPCBM/NEW2 domain-containing protein [Gemmataceae bacterium]|nr:NPCBM/NEW2 domain-containing protein [Gemmataceae bacterium]